MKQNLTKHFVLIALVAILGVIVGCATSLHYAASRGNISAVGNQLDKGVDVNTREPSGLTALMEASRNGHLEIVKLLIDKGADINAKDKKGFTALRYAVDSAQPFEVVKLLIDRGADISVKDKNGWTALWQAVSLAKFEVVKLLIDRGDNIYIPLGTAILLIPEHIYVSETIDERRINDYCMALPPGSHNITVMYLHSWFTRGLGYTSIRGEISLVINVEKGHIYAIDYSSDYIMDRWSAWIEKIK